MAGEAEAAFEADGGGAAIIGASEVGVAPELFKFKVQH
jgi:hypothetical protein